MGRRGPAKKPTALRLLHGDESRKINHDEPQPGPGTPTLPETRDRSTEALWDYVVAELDAMDLAKRPDRDQLYAYIESVRLHAEATEMVHRAGPLIKDDGGHVRTNPAVRIQNQAARTMLIFAREFGLTPASRVQFSADHMATDYAERLLS